MRLHHLFSEDAESDHAAHTAAANIVTKLIKYIQNSDDDDQNGLTGVRFSDGSEYLSVRGEKIGLTGDEAKIYFL